MISARKSGTYYLRFVSVCAVAFLFAYMIFTSPVAADEDVTTSDVQSLVDSLIDDISRDTASVRSLLPDGGIQVLPVRTVQEVIGLEGGVVSREIGYVSGNQPRLHFLGGESYHNRYYLNSVPMTNAHSGSFTATVSPSAIGNIGFAPGRAEAEYGNAIGGVVNVVTRSGSERYSGGIEIVTDNLIGSDYDQNWYSAHVGGPVPSIENARFFGAVERRWLGDRNPSPLADEQPGVSDGRLPNNSQSGWSYHGRVDWQLNTRLNLTLTGDASEDMYQQYAGYFNNPDYPTQIEHTPRHLAKNLGIGAHMEFAASDYTTLSFRASYFSQEWMMGDGVVFDEFDAYYRGAPNPGYDQYFMYRQGIDMYASWFDWYVPGDPDTLVAFFDSYWDNFEKQKTTGLRFNGEYKRDLGRAGSLVAGLDFERQAVRYFSSQFASMGYNAHYVNRYGYDSTGNESDDEDWQNEAKHPINLGLYLTANLEFGPVKITPRVRLDRFDYGALTLIDFMNPLGEDYVFDRADLIEADTHSKLSPSLGIAVAVHDRATVRASVGQYYQAPPVGYLHTGWDHFVSRVEAGSFALFGNAQLEPERARSAEVGANWEISDNITVDAEVFLRDSENSFDVAWVGSYWLWANSSAWDSRGLLLSLKARPFEQVSFRVGYTWSRARAEGGYYGSEHVINWSNPNAQPTVIYPQSHEQRHRVVGQFDVRPDKDTRFNLIADIGGGFPYTPMSPYDEVTRRPVRPGPIGPFNSERSPGWFTIDFKLERQFRFRSIKLKPFVWVKNLLDRKNVTRVYQSTGEPDYCGYLETEEGQVMIEDEGDVYQDRYELLERNPQHYGNPRQVYFGVRVLF